jgi:hypothetical protein
MTLTRCFGKHMGAGTTVTCQVRNESRTHDLRGERLSL